MSTWIIFVAIIVVVITVIIYTEWRNEKKYQEERRREQERRKRKPEPKITKRPRAKTSAPKSPITANDTIGAEKSHLPKSEPNKSQNTPVEPKPQPKKETKTAPLSTEEKSTPKPQTKRLNTQTAQKPLFEKPTQQPQPLKPQKQEAVLKRDTQSQAAPSPVETKEQTHDLDLPKGEYPDFNYDRLIEMGLSQEEALEFIQELIPQIGDQIPLIDEAMKIPDFHKMERLTHSIKGSSTTIGTGGVSDLLVEYNTYLKSGEELPIAEAYQKHLKTYFEKLKKQFPKKED